MNEWIVINSIIMGLIFPAALDCMTAKWCSVNRIIYLCHFLISTGVNVTQTRKFFLWYHNVLTNSTFIVKSQVNTEAWLVPHPKINLKESIRKRIFGPVHIHLDVTVRVTNQIPPIYPIISTQSSFENYAKMRLESRRLPPYLFTCDVTHSLSVESHLQAIVLHFILSIKFPH